jgi:hypothetical protein
MADGWMARRSDGATVLVMRSAIEQGLRIIDRLWEFLSADLNIPVGDKSRQTRNRRPTFNSGYTLAIVERCSHRDPE